jgi:hypothetical protein
VDFMAAAEGFMGVVAISAAVVLGGVVAVTAGVAVGIEVAGTAAAMGMVAAGTGTEVVLLIGGGIIHTLMGLTVGKS